MFYQTSELQFLLAGVSIELSVRNTGSEVVNCGYLRVIEEAHFGGISASSKLAFIEV